MPDNNPAAMQNIDATNPCDQRIEETDTMMKLSDAGFFSDPNSQTENYEPIRRDAVLWPGHALQIQ